MLRVFLRQKECFVVAAVFVEISNVGAGVRTIVAARGENYPSAVTAPRVVGIYIGTIGSGEGADGSCLKVLDIEVGTLVPDMELTEISHREEHIAAVGTDTGEGDAARGVALHFNNGLAKGARLLVEGNAHQIVANGVVTCEKRIAMYGVGEVGKEGRCSRAVVHAATIGRPVGEGFHGFLALDDIGQCAVVNIKEDEVRTIVKHFNLLLVDGVECLPREIAGEDHPILLGVPRRVNAVGEHAVALHVHLAGLAVVNEDGAAVVGANVEEHVLGAVILVVVAVHAVVVVGIVRAIVFVDGLLREISQVALIYAQLTIEFVTRFNKTVTQVRVNFFLRHGDGILGEFHPARLLFGVDSHAEFAALVVAEQLPPLGGVYLEFALLVGIHDNLPLLARNASGIGGAGVLDLHIQRGNIGWNHNIAVIGK